MNVPTVFGVLGLATNIKVPEISPPNSSHPFWSPDGNQGWNVGNDPRLSHWICWFSHIWSEPLFRALTPEPVLCLR